MAMPLLCKCLFQVILFGVLFKGTQNGWVNSASLFPSPQPLGFLMLQGSLLSRTEALTLRPGLTSPACDLLVVARGNGVLRRA